MSFSFTKEGPADEVAKAVLVHEQIPASIKSYIQGGINNLQLFHKNDAINVHVTAHGHAFNGRAGWAEDTSATVKLHAVISKPAPAHSH